MSSLKKTDAVNPIYVSVAKKVSLIILALAFVAMLLYVIFLYPTLPSTVWFVFFGGKIATTPLAYSNNGLFLESIIFFGASLVLVVISRILARSKANNTRQSLSIIFAIVPSTLLVGFLMSLYIWAMHQVNLVTALTYDQAESLNASTFWSLFVGFFVLVTLAIFLLIPYYLIKKSGSKKK